MLYSLALLDLAFPASLSLSMPFGRRFPIDQLRLHWTQFFYWPQIKKETLIYNIAFFYRSIIMVTVELTVIVGVLLAFVGYFATYLNNRSIARRNDRLQRVNRQISFFYGPLYALVHTTNTAWDYFRKRWRPDKLYFWDTTPTKAEQAMWRLWMTEVFMPKNLQMEKIIIDNIDLIEEPEIPDCLLDLLAHVAAYKTILKKWEMGDFSEHITEIEFPRKSLLKYVEARYKELKVKQLRDLKELDKAWSVKTSS